MKLNENIKTFRTFRGVTQQALADTVGKTKSVISNWERGENQPDVDSIELICKCLNVTPNQLFGWEPNPEYEKFIQRFGDAQKKIAKLRNERDKIDREIAALSEHVMYGSERTDSELFLEQISED